MDSVYIRRIINNTVEKALQMLTFLFAFLFTNLSLGHYINIKSVEIKS